MRPLPGWSPPCEQRGALVLRCPHAAALHTPRHALGRWRVPRRAARRRALLAPAPASGTAALQSSTLYQKKNTLCTLREFLHVTHSTRWHARLRTAQGWHARLNSQHHPIKVVLVPYHWQIAHKIQPPLSLRRYTHRLYSRCLVSELAAKLAASSCPTASLVLLHPHQAACALNTVLLAQHKLHSPRCFAVETDL